MVRGSMKTSIFVYSWVMKSQRAHQGGEATFLLTETLGSLLLLSSSHLWLCQVDMDPKKRKKRKRIDASLYLYVVQIKQAD